jgi:hypothetical protein
MKYERTASIFLFRGFFLLIAALTLLQDGVNIAPMY